MNGSINTIRASIAALIMIASVNVLASGGEDSLFEALAAKGSSYSIKGEDQIKSNELNCYLEYKEYSDGNYLGYVYRPHNKEYSEKIGAYQDKYDKTFLSREITYVLDNRNPLGDLLSDVFYGGKYTATKVKHKLKITYNKKYEVTEVLVIDLKTDEIISNCINMK